MRVAGILAVWLLTTTFTYAKMPYDAVCKLDGKTCTGSGTLVAVIGGKGLILTEAHVLPKETEMTASWPAFKDSSRVAKPIYVSYAYDTALMVVDNPPAQAVRISLRLDPTEELYSVGFPWYSRDKLHYQKGTIEKFEGCGAFITSRPAPAMSGGAVFNARGSLVGSISATQGDGTGGVMVTNSIITPILLTFADPETWQPITSHLRPNKKFTYAKKEKVVTTEAYDEQSAPDLSPDAIETKVPVTK